MADIELPPLRRFADSSLGMCEARKGDYCLNSDREARERILLARIAELEARPVAVPEGMVMVQHADLAALEATDFGRCGWSARADLAARRLRAAMLAAAKGVGS